MQPGKISVLGALLLAPGFVFLAMGPSAIRGDEPSRLGRLLRFGSTSTANSTTPVSPEVGSQIASRPAPSFGSSVPAVTPALVPTTPTGPQPRIVAQPRFTKAVTDADPIVTRISLGRSDEGTQFGMFLQVYADGTVIDSEGVHHVAREDLKPILDVLSQSEIHRAKGHCGSPSTDFVEHVQMVVYERSYGRLKANSFSFSGNTQGCDHAVRHLQTSLDALQAKLSRSVPASAAAVKPATAPGAPISNAPAIQLDHADPASP